MLDAYASRDHADACILDNALIRTILHFFVIIHVNDKSNVLYTLLRINIEIKIGSFIIYRISLHDSQTSLVILHSCDHVTPPPTYTTHTKREKESFSCSKCDARLSFDVRNCVNSWKMSNREREREEDIDDTEGVGAEEKQKWKAGASAGPNAIAHAGEFLVVLASLLPRLSSSQDSSDGPGRQL